MLTRPCAPRFFGAAVLVTLGVVVALVPAWAQQIHRHGFAGRNTVLVRGDANVRTEEKQHDISDQSFKSQPSSEHLQLAFDVGTGDTAFVHYVYKTPEAPVSDALSASVWVKATKPGVQLRARVVFPKEPDPARPEARLTMLIVGKTYERTRSWDKLTLENIPQLVGKHLAAVRANIGHDVNTADAYVDQLVLNVYTGPGPVDIWVDDLDVGPVRPAPRPDPSQRGAPGVSTAQPKADTPATVVGRGRQVEQRGGRLLVDGEPYFFRAIRHTGTPLHVLQAAGFNSLWLPPDASPELIEEAGREGWLVIPSAPTVDVTNVKAAPEEVEFDTFRRKFGGSDVLFWNLGGGLTQEQASRVRMMAGEIRKVDRRRPLGGDLWDGYRAYSEDLAVVGAHRWPLFTSLEMVKYRDWLAQRQLLTGSGPLFWTWIQNHLPDWYVANIASRPVDRRANPPAEDTAFADPVGPHPEQVRLLTYISLACGCQGLGFWSDRYLADAYHGRDRLQGMALLNSELDMLKPLLLSAGMTGTRPQWIRTNHPNVKAALISSQRGLVLLPIWFGSGDQYVPSQGAVSNLKITVPGVADGYDPWLITPAGVECLRRRAVRTSDGTELTIDEFELVTPIVFTDDQTPNGLVVKWQDYTRRYGKSAARWAIDLVKAEFKKVRDVHLKLAAMGVQVPGAEKLLQEADRLYQSAERNSTAESYDRAYGDATRALRPLRVLMRDHWEKAIVGLDVPTASPFAVSYFSLPQHWELAREVQASQPSPSVLPYGAFEVSGEIPANGIPVGNFPGWSARGGSLVQDRVEFAAGVVSSDKLADDRKPKTSPKPIKSLFAPSRAIVPPDEGYLPPGPELGKGTLKLEVRSKILKDRDGKPIPFVQPLERTFLAVDSPPVRLPPGTLVRISGWIRVKSEIAGTADGALMYDDAGGEPLAVRVLNTDVAWEPSKPAQSSWKKFHLYRRVPVTGQISVTLALTGIGVAYFDDIRIEPLVVGTAATAKRPTNNPGGKAPPPGAATNGARSPVVPVGYRPQ